MFLDFLWKRKESQKISTDYNDSQAVIIDIDFQGIEEFGSRNQREQVELLEQDLEMLIPDRSSVDGNEFGDGTCTIYVYGSSADSIFAAIETALTKSPFPRIDITLQYGQPEDVNTKDKKFTLIG